ncbi:hypothetical protein [Sulfitobacter sp. 1A12157]|uniref:DUF4376 domain-containing protein n=1 Tax=Sulfitobacter sp. 1A12157 TaxID=3368594 RepID=UPI0037461FD0
MKYAIIENGKVANVALADEPLAGNWVASEVAQIGWLYDGETFTRPPAPAATDADVNAERTRRLEVGSAFTVAGVADPIPLQGREFDRTVYLALLTRAQGYKAAGVTDPVLNIRAADDVTHNLTPDQMISLVTQSMNWFEAVMAVSWAMKDGTGDFPEGIPADYADDTHWP